MLRTMAREEKLLDRTERLFRQTNKLISLREIAERSSVGFEWLRKFSQGKIDDPGVKSVQALHDFCDLYQRARKNDAAIQERAPAA